MQNQAETSETKNESDVIQKEFCSLPELDISEFKKNCGLCIEYYE